jgi:virulence-associated protein VapD
MNDTNIIYIVHELPNKSKHYNNYGFEISTKEISENIKNILYKLDNIDKPIKSISAYKVEDLLNIANKLAIEVTNNLSGKHKSKKDLYELIVQYF